MSDVGVQGFLRVTISILGPDDKTVYHDLAKEVADEAKNNPSGELTNVVMPSVRQKLEFLTLRVHEARGLPIMDIAGVSGHGIELNTGIDCYVTVSFAGNDNVRSKLVKGSPAKGAKRCEVVWNEEISLPVYVPCGSHNIAINVWDDDTGANQMVG